MSNADLPTHTHPVFGPCTIGRIVEKPLSTLAIIMDGEGACQVVTVASLVEQPTLWQSDV